MAENTRRMNNEPVFGSLAYDLNTLNWGEFDGNAVRQPQEQPQEEPNDLQQDAYPEVNTLVQSYFDARANGDVDALRATVSELDDEEADSVTKMSQHIESYNNITCYTKRGPAEKSYVVYVCYDI